ncbi:MAG: hypothetical protein NC213_05600 [Acetobacter sp.]|nr:hypothetical protein [Bacteroides sp.]MCM1341202.1 hypothetical protein [Acetobacter sp.]MCM1433845.1 hypothetical protein [Clostridiales bacterium]
MAKREKEAYELAKKVFDDYFSRLAVENINIKFITYQEKADEKNNRVYSAVIDYDNFRQYVNFYEKDMGNAFVNCAFEFDKYLCHFGEILNAIDSDDLSFYSYPMCYNENLILSALSNIMNATEKYMADISYIANSAEMQEKIYTNLAEHVDEETIAEKDVLTDYDEQYFIFDALIFNLDEGYQDFLNSLKRKKKKGKLTDAYEIRAERVLSKLSKKELKNVHTKVKKTKADKFYMYAPYAVIAVIFAIIFGAVGVKVQMSLYNGCIGVDYFSSALGFGVAGASLSVILTSLINDKIYKIIVPKSKKDHFEMILELEKSSVWGTVLIAAGTIAIAVFSIVMFTCSGFGFKNNEIRHREYIFETFETCYFEDVEIAEVKGTVDSDGYSEYIDTAYAFKIGGEWFDYGVPDDDAKKLIESNIEKYNKQLKTADSIEDLE